MKIDMHCHIFQNDLSIDTLRLHFGRFKGYGFYERILKNIPNQDIIKTKNIIEKAIYFIKKARLDKVVLLPVNYNENLVVKAWFDAAPDLFIPFFNPPEKSIDLENEKEMVEEAIKEKGYKGFKIMLSFRKKQLNDEILFPTLEVAAKYKIPVLMHCGYPPPGTKKSVLTYSNPVVIDEFINLFPEVPVIIAHMGFPWTDIAIALATQYPNVYLDVSNLAYMMPNHLKTLLLQAKEIMGLHKVLFGSDGFLPEMIQIAVNYFETAEFLTQDELIDILGRNAQKLLKFT